MGLAEAGMAVAGAGGWSSDTPIGSSPTDPLALVALASGMALSIPTPELNPMVCSRRHKPVDVRVWPSKLG